MKLREAYTYYIMPFEIETDAYSVISELKRDIWEPAHMNKLEDNILYPHIQGFLQDMKDAEMHWGVHKKQTEHHWRIFSLRNEYAGVTSARQEQFQQWKKLTKMDFSITDKFQEKKVITFNIVATGGDFQPPHLIISPLAGVGMLMFSVQMKGERTIQDLIDLNYVLHKIDKNQLIQWQLDTTELKKKVEKSEEEYNKQTDPKKKDGIKKGLDRNRQALADAEKTFEQSDVNNMMSLCKFFLGSIYESISLFNETRLHLLTYYQLEKVDLTQDVEKEQIDSDLARISRGVNSKYQLDIAEVRDQWMLMKTFGSVRMATAVEGCAFMTLLPDSRDDFFKNFHKDSFSKRYIWIYLLALMQRYTLLHMISELTHIDDDDLKVTVDKLREKVEHLSTVKVNTYFFDVSDYTHHNQFYRFCCHNLHIPEYFKEIDEKMDILTSVISHKEQKDAERRDNYLALILALLTALSATGDVFSSIDQFSWIRFISMIVMAAIVFLVWKNYKNWKFWKRNK